MRKQPAHPNWAARWLDAHFDDVGRTSTIDLEEIMEDAPRHVRQAAAPDAQAAPGRHISQSA